MSEPTVTLGALLRERRIALLEEDPEYSLRKVAARTGIDPANLSRAERDEGRTPLSEAALTRLARDLGLSVDRVLALAGHVPADVREAIQSRPEVLGELIRSASRLPDETLRRLTIEVREGTW